MNFFELDWSMQWLLLLTAIILLAVLFGWLSRPGPRKEVFPFACVDSLLTESELAFYRVLLPAVDGDFRIFCKPRLADVITVPNGTVDWRSHFNRIQAKHVDFVLCDLIDLSPLLVIELDDPSHDRPDRQERDAFVDQALAAARLPILHVPTAPEYLAADLRAAIDTELNEPWAA